MINYKDRKIDKQTVRLKDKYINRNLTHTYKYKWSNTIFIDNII